MNKILDPWIKIGHIDDIPKRGARTISFDEKTIALFRNQENQIFALEDKCPHKAGPLSNGIIHDDCVTCPLHNWVISLKSGQALGADEGKTKSYPIKVDQSIIYIDLTHREHYEAS